MTPRNRHLIYLTQTHGVRVCCLLYLRYRFQLTLVSLNVFIKILICHFFTLNVSVSLHRIYTRSSVEIFSGNELFVVSVVFFFFRKNSHSSVASKCVLLFFVNKLCSWTFDELYLVQQLVWKTHILELCGFFFRLKMFAWIGSKSINLFRKLNSFIS